MDLLTYLNLFYYHNAPLHHEMLTNVLNGMEFVPV